MKGIRSIMTLLHLESVYFEREEEICMQKKEGYEVFRFIERGDYCHASLDYVEGITLYDWISLHREMEKGILYIWIRELLCQLVLFHRQREAPEYGRLNPYTVVIMRKGKIALLAGEDNGLSGGLSKYFRPPGNIQNIDVYCFGKIIQFIMAHVQCEPGLSKIEEYKLQKIVKKCLETNPKRRYEDIHMVQTNFTKTKKLKPDRKMYLIMATFALSIGIFGFISGEQVLRKDTEHQIKNERIAEKNMISEVTDGEDERERIEKELFLQAGMDYFLEYEEYEKSLEYLKMADIQDEQTQYYLKLAEFMIGDKSSSDLRRLEEELRRGDSENEEWGIKEKLAIIRIYEKSNSEKYNSKIKEFMKKEEVGQQQEELSDKLQYEYIKYQAILYEQSREWEEAVDCYDLLNEADQKEEEKKNMKKKGLETEVKYLEEMWEDITMDDEEKLQVIKKSVAQKPELMKNEKFITFISKRKIHIEEGKIWKEDMKKADKREDAG